MYDHKHWRILCLVAGVDRSKCCRLGKKKGVVWEDRPPVLKYPFLAAATPYKLELATKDNDGKRRSLSLFSCKPSGYLWLAGGEGGTTDSQTRC